MLGSGLANTPTTFLSQKRKLTIGTNKHSLLLILNLIDASERLARWRLCLLKFDVAVHHHVAVQHRASNAFLRLPIKEAVKVQSRAALAIMCINKIDESRHGGTPYLLEHINSTFMHVKLEPSEFETKSIAELFNGQSKSVL